jgi:hypothetical protein
MNRANGKSQGVEFSRPVPLPSYDRWPYPRTVAAYTQIGHKRYFGRRPFTFARPALFPCKSQGGALPASRPGKAKIEMIPKA